mgnify:CR=1 FL=1
MKKKIRNKTKLFGLFVSVLAIGTFAAAMSEHVTSVGANDGTYQTYSDPNEAFISQIGESARQLGQENDLYASVMIAQAILESGSGQSGLSGDPHYNLFGIKGHYDGQSANMETWEDDGEGNAYTINDSFRSYPSYVESLQDYVTVLKQGHFAGAWKSNAPTYQDATAALTGVYATDTSYNAKLNYIIEKYDLTRFDSPLYESGAGYIVYNPYRQQYTTQDILDVDTAWANRF